MKRTLLMIGLGVMLLIAVFSIWALTGSRKRIALYALGFDLLPSTGYPEETFNLKRTEDPVLSAAIILVRYDASSDRLHVDFSLTNKTDETVWIWERTNFWGGHNWMFEMKSARGGSFMFHNPIGDWSGNRPQWQEIKARSTLVLHCLLQLKAEFQATRRLSDGAFFEPVAMTHEKADRWYEYISSGPFRLRGIYGNDRSESGLPWRLEREKGSWVGVTISEWITLPELD